MSIARPTADEIRGHCLHKAGAWLDEPWEGDRVVKVGDRIFAFLGDDTVGVKCGRGRAEADEWLAEFPDDVAVMSYIGRHGWNTLRLDGAIPAEAIVEAIDASYELVLAGLPKAKRP